MTTIMRTMDLEPVTQFSTQVSYSLTDTTRTLVTNDHVLHDKSASLIPVSGKSEPLPAPEPEDPKPETKPAPVDIRDIPRVLPPREPAQEPAHEPTQEPPKAAPKELPKTDEVATNIELGNDIVFPKGFIELPTVEIRWTQDTRSRGSKGSSIGIHTRKAHYVSFMSWNVTLKREVLTFIATECIAKDYEVRDDHLSKTFADVYKTLSEKEVEVSPIKTDEHWQWGELGIETNHLGYGVYSERFIVYQPKQRNIATHYFTTAVDETTDALNAMMVSGSRREEQQHIRRPSSYHHPAGTTSSTHGVGVGMGMGMGIPMLGYLCCCCDGNSDGVMAANSTPFQHHQHHHTKHQQSATGHGLFTFGKHESDETLHQGKLDEKGEMAKSGMLSEAMREHRHGHGHELHEHAHHGHGKGRTEAVTQTQNQNQNGKLPLNEKEILERKAVNLMNGFGEE